MDFNMEFSQEDASFDMKFAEQQGGGQDGFSPIVKVEQIEGGHRIFITDKQGVKQFDVLNGQNGESVEIVNISESVEDGGYNIITFNNGTVLKVKNGDRGSVQIEPLFASSTEECVDTSKVYILPDGYIYAWMKDVQQIEIETTRGGYYNNNGGWVEQSGAYGQRTNLIPVSEGEQFELTSMAIYQASVIWFNSAEQKISHETYGKSGNKPETVVVTAPSGAKYARFYSYSYSASELHLEVIPLNVRYSWKNTGVAFVQTDVSGQLVDLQAAVNVLSNNTKSALKGKKIVYDGDSISESRANNGGGFPTLIAVETESQFVNQSVGGAYLRSTSVSGKHSVVDNLENLPNDADIYCFEGGINDYWSGAELGDFSPSDFKGAVNEATV